MARLGDETQTTDDGPRDAAGLLELWARQYRQPLLRYFQKRVPAAVEPDDLVQEVFVRLAKRADLATIERVNGYLFQTASNVLADHFRKDACQPDFVEPYEDSEHGEAVFAPEHVLIERQLFEELIKALYALPERTRHIFVLHHFENTRQKTIANMLGMPISTVEKHMARANKQLLARLRQLK